MVLWWAEEKGGRGRGRELEERTGTGVLTAGSQKLGVMGTASC